ncbi:MAG: pitrilysin family protein [Acidobacteriota bacterium]
MSNLRSSSWLATLLGSASLLLVLACDAPQPAPSASEKALEAGHVLMQVPDDPTISFVVWFKVGSQNDPPGKEGLASLTGALLSGGATTVSSYEEILEKLYPLASSYGVQVDKEMTTLQGRTHRDNLATFFSLLQDAYLRPAFNEDDFERLRSNQLNYLEKTLRFASDEELGKAALTEFVFDGTPYRHPTAGTVTGLQAITLDDVRAFYQSHYTRGNAVVALGGGYDDSLVEQFVASLDGLPAGEAVAPPTVTPATIDGRHVTLVSKPGADASISFGFPIDLQRGSRDFYALWLANSWLGEHRNSSSHLYKVIRETRGMNYGDYSYIEKFPNGGTRQMPPTGVGRRHQIFEVWIRTLPNDQALFALRAALRELDKLVQSGMTEETFELTRSFLSKYYLHFAETTGQRLGYRVDDSFYGIDGDGHLARFGEMMSSLTLEEVNAAITKYLQLDNLKIAIVTGEAEALQKAMLEDAPSPMTYSIEKPAEVLEEDKEIEDFPLTIAEDGVRVVPVEDIFGQ